MERKETAGSKFRICKGLLCFVPKGVRRRHWVIPSSVRSMLLQYFHDGIFAGHLGARKTLSKTGSNFWWPNPRKEVFHHVRRCELCQRGKPVQNMQVGLHSAEPASRPMEKLFVDFVGPLVQSKRSNVAILIVVDAFHKICEFLPGEEDGLAGGVRMSGAWIFSCIWHAPVCGER